MHLIPQDLYLGRHSPLHQASATMKLCSALILVAATALAPRTQWLFFAGIGALLVTLIILGRLPLKRMLLRLLFLEPFVLSVALLSLVQQHGLTVFLGLLTRSTLCVLTMLILVSSTPFSDTLRALRALHVPGLVVTILALTYRYLFMLLGESERMRRARLSRTFSGGRVRQWQAFSTIIAELFVRTSLRAERVYAAMCARGWKS